MLGGSRPRTGAEKGAGRRLGLELFEKEDVAMGGCFVVSSSSDIC